MALMSLKHKLKALKWDQKKELEKMEKKFTLERDNAIAQVEQKITSTFNEEMKHLVREKFEIQHEVETQQSIVRKLTMIIARQEIDTYDPNIDLPRDYFGFLKHANEFLKRDNFYRCFDCAKLVQRKTLNKSERQDVEETI